MGKVVRLILKVESTLHRSTSSITIKGHAAYTVVERCQASGLGQVVATGKYNAERQKRAAKKAQLQGMTTVLCPSRSY